MRPAHVAVVRQDNNGDVLLAGPAIRAVAAGARRVTLIAGPRGAAAAALLPGVDEVLVHEAAWIDALPKPLDASHTLAFVAHLRRHRIDAACILTSFHQSALPMALLLRLAGVQTIAAISEDYAGTLLTIRHGVSDSIHEVERALSIVATLGYRLPDGDDGALRMRSEPFEERSLPARYVVVHPGATVPARRWSPQSNAALVHALCARRTNVVVTGGPDEAALTRFVAGSHPRAVDLGAKTTLGQLAAILARADAIVVGNTGAAHVAAAVGCPVVSIFPPTIPVVRFAPWRVACAVLGNQQIGCAGCRARECPRGDHACVACVTVDDVLAALARVHMPPAKRSRVPGGMRLDRSAFAGGAASGAVAGP